MTDAGRGTNYRGTADRGTSRRGLADAGFVSTVRPEAGTRDAGSADAGIRDSSALQAIGFFVYQVAQTGGSKPIAEATGICRRPIAGLWRQTQLIKSVADLVAQVGAAAGQFQIVRLGILAHGDAGGVLTIGPDTIDPGSFDSHRSKLAELGRYLAPNADLYIYGCISGAGRDGSAVLRELSAILPGRRIIGFNVINAVAGATAGDVRRDEGAPCYDPKIWCTDTLNPMSATRRTINEATDDAPQAKIALNGKVTKWPTYVNEREWIFAEKPETSDATLKERQKTDTWRPRKR